MKTIKKMTLILFCLLQLSSWSQRVLSADVQENYAKQVEALKAAFADQDVEKIKPYISPELTFGPVPAANTVPILTQVFKSFPKANRLELMENLPGKALVAYDFPQLGKDESYIFFDDEGKITGIEYIENIILEQIKAQQALSNSVQAPVPGELGKKYPGEKVTFTAKDGLEVTGTLYEKSKKGPVILLCHQAGYNKYEYADIAPRLNEMGYNCLAIDQRSGGPFADHQNETFAAASAKSSEEITMISAQQDIEAAVKYLSKRYKQKVILWGSSYSSSLVLFEAQKNKKVKAVISFSPGDYFGEETPSLQEVIPSLKQPFLVTSSKDESSRLKDLIGTKPLQKNQSQFIPQGDGFHGSRAVWVGQKGAEEYWGALKDFLASID